MVKFKYDNTYDSVILEHEKMMEERVRDMLKPYEEEFARLGFTFTSTLFWYDWVVKKAFYERFPFRKGYESAINVKIEKEGEILWYNGEDFLFWETVTTFSNIDIRPVPIDVYLIDDTSEFIEELDLYLEAAKSLANKEVREVIQMVEFKYNRSHDTRICEHEEMMWQMIQDIVESYKEKFSKYGFELTCRRSWSKHNMRHGHIPEFSSNRIPFSNGYQCVMGADALKNGELFCYDEAEGCRLTKAVIVSRIVPHLFLGWNVYLYDSDEIKKAFTEEIRVYVESCKQRVWRAVAILTVGSFACVQNNV